jgi:hypothetical protein
VIDGHLVGTQVFGDEGPIRPAIQQGRSPERDAAENGGSEPLRTGATITTLPPIWRLRSALPASPRPV